MKNPIRELVVELLFRTEEAEIEYRDEITKLEKKLDNMRKNFAETLQKQAYARSWLDEHPEEAE